MGERTAKASQRGVWAVWAEEITKSSVLEEPCWNCRACRLFPSCIATAMSVVLFQLMMHQGKTGALPPLHTSTLADSLRSQTQNAACHVGALKSTGWHAIHYTLLLGASRLIASLREMKVRAVLVEAHFKLLAPFRQTVEAYSGESWEPLTERLPCLTGRVTQFTVGRLLCALLWPGLYWAGMRANAPYLCGQGSHWLDWRACSSYSHTESSLHRQQQGDPVKVLKSFTREAAQLVIKGHLPFPLRFGPSRALILIPG